MKTFTLLQRYEDASKLWHFVLPEIPPPDNKTWTRWLDGFLDSEIEKAIVITSQRFRKHPPVCSEHAYAFFWRRLLELRDRRKSGVKL
jgi:hypothetical protein